MRMIAVGGNSLQELGNDRRALITGIAALFSATGAAYATELPDHMFGACCESLLPSVGQTRATRRPAPSHRTPQRSVALSEAPLSSCSVSRISRSTPGQHRQAFDRGG
jgi:hypothetical protein